MNRSAIEKSLSVFGLFLLVALSLPASAWGNFSTQGDLKHIHQASPGEQLTGSFTVAGVGEESETVVAFPAEHITPDEVSGSEEGEATFERSAAEWLTVTPTQAEVSPGEETTFRYTIQVPEYENLTGTYWTNLIMEPEDTSVDEEQQGISIKQVVRYAATIIIHIGDSGSLDMEIREVSISPYPSNGSQTPPQLTAEIFNAGGRYGMVVPVLDIYSSDGSRVGTFINETRTAVYPGMTRSITVPLDDTLDPGEYQASLVMESGSQDSTTGARFNFTVKPPTQQDIEDMIPAGGEKTLVSKEGADPEGDVDSSITIAVGEDESGSGESGQGEGSAAGETGQAAGSADDESEQADSGEQDEAA